MKHLVNTMRETRDGAKKPRLWLYSGHDDTVSSLGIATRTWGEYYPDFNAMLVLELLKKTDTGEYAVQVRGGRGRRRRCWSWWGGGCLRSWLIPPFGQFLLRESHAVNIHVVPVQGCEENPCPLDKFHKLVKDVIPVDWRKECLSG